MPDTATVGSLCVEDLYLACACLMGVGRSSETFVARYQQLIRRVAGKVCPDATAAEIGQEVLTDLLVGSATSAPQLSAYAGRSALARWLEVVSHRAALQSLRSERSRVAVVMRAYSEPERRPTPTDMALFRARYMDAFQDALKTALEGAPKQDRAVLRLYFIENVPVEQIGKRLGISQSSASRWLAKARTGVLDDVKTILARHFGMSLVELEHEVESFVGAFGSRLGSSILQALKSE